MDAFVEIGAGRIHYRMQGSGAPLLLLHSNGASLYEFDGNMDALADRFTVIAWDMPGHGDSTPIATHMTVEAYSDALDQFLNALGIDSATVAGSSIGAVIAADFAARYPHRVKKTVLIELAARPERWWAEHWEMVEAMFSIPQQSADAVAKRLVSEPSETLVRRWNIDRHKAGGYTMMDVMWAGREYDVEAALPRIAAPVLLIYGSRSPVMEPAPRLQRALPDAALSILEGAGHFPMLDAPDAFNHALIEFA
jgi:pimeloyl-ACP methyl ester carboxylesterase